MRFVHEDGSVVYYATYTAFDGLEVLPQLIETADFVSFRVGTLNGSHDAPLKIAEDSIQISRSGRSLIRDEQLGRRMRRARE